MNNPRRTFLMTVAAAGSALAFTAHAEEMVDPSNPTAKALGYEADTTKVDAAKFPKHTAEQQCANCALYVKVDEKAGNCPLFAGKHVAAQGWCSAWAKKA